MKSSRIIWVLLLIVLAIAVSRWGQEQGLGWDFGLLGPHHKVTLTWTPSDASRHATELPIMPPPITRAFTRLRLPAR